MNKIMREYADVNLIQMEKDAEEGNKLANDIRKLTNLEPDKFLKKLSEFGLAEPPEKVKVPKFVGKRIEEVKEDE